MLHFFLAAALLIFSSKVGHAVDAPTSLRTLEVRNETLAIAGENFRHLLQGLSLILAAVGAYFSWRIFNGASPRWKKTVYTLLIALICIAFVYFAFKVMNSLIAYRFISRFAY